MAKLAPTSIKYIIKAEIKAKGIVEKPDVIGAVFGQTEGLLGADLDLRELQETGRIGRIEVNIRSNQGNSEGEIIIPSSLDASETALIAASLETIERVGPCTAEIRLLEIEDTRSEKRKYVVDKAQEILKTMMDSGVPDSNEISDQIKEAVRTHELTTFHGFPAGPNFLDSQDVIIVEGRADILNLLRYGIRNTIAIEGTSINHEISNVTKEKEVTLFVDGDRGGQLIFKELSQLADVDFVAMAPTGKEVEELTKKEIFKALRDKIPAEEFKNNFLNGKSNNHRFPSKEFRPKENQQRGERPFGQKFKDKIGKYRDNRDRERPENMDRFPNKRDQRPQQSDIPRIKNSERDLFRKTIEDLVGTRAACIFNSSNELLGKVPVSELENTLKDLEDTYAIVFDGRIDYRLTMAARTRGVKIIIGMEKEDNLRSPITILTRKDLERVNKR